MLQGKFFAVGAYSLGSLSGRGVRIIPALEQEAVCRLVLYLGRGGHDAGAKLFFLNLRLQIIGNTHNLKIAALQKCFGGQKRRLKRRTASFRGIGKPCVLRHGSAVVYQAGCFYGSCGD